MERTGLVNNGGGSLAFSFGYLLTLDKCLKVAGLDPPRREARGAGGAPPGNLRTGTRWLLSSKGTSSKYKCLWKTLAF